MKKSPVFAAVLAILFLVAACSSPPVHHHAARLKTPVGLQPPSSISSNCTKDATAGLNAFFAGLPANATVNLPTNACYLVSNSTTSTFSISDRYKTVINGNGATFKQTSYTVTGDPQQPVLTLRNNLVLTINGVTLKGPSTNGGSNVEGDIGLLMTQNVGVTLNSVTITNVEGDGLDVYPFGNTPGVNWYTTVNNSTISAGYHAVVVEAADYFNLENSTITKGNIDNEVDFNCKGNLPNCGTLSNPSIGVVNMTLNHNSFPGGLALEDGMSCMPVGNWAITNNNLGTGGLDLQFDTTYSLSLSALLSCGLYSGLTITGNTSTGQTQHDCCGSGSPFIVLQGWSNVTISGNHLVFNPANAVAGDAVVDLWSDNEVAIKNNVFTNLNTVATAFAPAGWPANVGIVQCGNHLGVKGLATDARC